MGRPRDRARDPLARASSAFPLADYGTDAQQQERLAALRAAPPSCRARSRCSSRASTPTPSARSTTARRDGGDYVLDGAKCLVPWLDGRRRRRARDAPTRAARRSSSSCRATRAGLTAERERNMGLAALPTAELALEGVRVPAAARLGGDAGADLRRARRTRAASRSPRSASASRARPSSTRATTPRSASAFGAPIAQKQAIAFMLADMAIEIDAARLLAWEAAWKLDQGEDAHARGHARQATRRSASRSSRRQRRPGARRPRLHPRPPARAAAAQRARLRQLRRPRDGLRSARRMPIDFELVRRTHDAARDALIARRSRPSSMRPISREVRRARARAAVGVRRTDVEASRAARAARGAQRTAPSDGIVQRLRADRGALLGRRRPLPAHRRSPASAARRSPRPARPSRRSASSRASSETASRSGPRWRSPSRSAGSDSAAIQTTARRATATSGC